MTTKVIVINDNAPGYPMRVLVEPRNPHAEAPLSTFTTLLTAGQSEIFYVHSHMQLLVSEVGPDVPLPITPRNSL